MKRLFLGVLAMMVATSTNSLSAKAPSDKADNAYGFTMKSLDGKDVDLSKYQGKVVLFVNVASKCGYTKQYAGLQDLHAKYSEKGLVVVGVPSNQFGAQEPGTSEEIAEFCKKNYGVTFDMLSKVDVNGDQQAPLYKYLTNDAGKEFAGPIKWNFEKFLVGPDGKVVARFPSAVKPDAPELTKAVEEQLAKKG